MKAEALLEEASFVKVFRRLHPKVAAFLKGFARGVRPVEFGGGVVLDANFPPFPSEAFKSMLGHLDGAKKGGVAFATLAVTNRCGYKCVHCYNAGRKRKDMPLSRIKELARELQEMGVAMMTLSGGDPLLRDDLPEIAAAFDERSCVRLDSSGCGFDLAIAKELGSAGVFSLGVSLDSPEEAEHDARRGVKGAWRGALSALETASAAGLYPYAVTVPFRSLLEREAFFKLLRLARRRGALEVQLLEACATGRLAGVAMDKLSPPDAATRILGLEAEANAIDDETLPNVSSFSKYESAEAFGCCAGSAQIYIDGSGEVCPCNLMPTSFGNVMDESLSRIVGRMREFISRPMASCACKRLQGRIPAGAGVPTPKETSMKLCAELFKDEELPGFFKLTSDEASAGTPELEESYDKVHGDYDRAWLSLASAPVEELLRKIAPLKPEHVFEAGCGTGFATKLLTELPDSREIVACDVSEGMLAEARRRLRDCPPPLKSSLVKGDALTELRKSHGFDLVVASWSLGYIGLEDFFRASYESLIPGGALAFVVHKKDSPREPLELFAKILAERPEALLKKVDFDFPEDALDLKTRLSRCGFDRAEIREGVLDFKFQSGAEALEHLLKSGAGTAFHDALDPEARPEMERRFTEAMDAAREADGLKHVRHEYLLCVARRPSREIVR